MLISEPTAIMAADPKDASMPKTTNSPNKTVRGSRELRLPEARRVALSVIESGWVVATWCGGDPIRQGAPIFFTAREISGTMPYQHRLKNLDSFGLRTVLDDLAGEGQLFRNVEQTGHHTVRWAWPGPAVDPDHSLDVAKAYRRRLANGDHLIYRGVHEIAEWLFVDLFRTALKSRSAKGITYPRPLAMQRLGIPTVYGHCQLERLLHPDRARDIRVECYGPAARLYPEGVDNDGGHFMARHTQTFADTHWANTVAASLDRRPLDGTYDATFTFTRRGADPISFTETSWRSANTFELFLLWCSIAVPFGWKVQASHSSGLSWSSTIAARG